MVAKEQGLTREQLAQQAVAAGARRADCLHGHGGGGGQVLGTALKTFIGEPKSLDIRIGTSEPIPAIAFTKVSEGDQDALGLIKKSVTIEATANK